MPRPSAGPSGPAPARAAAERTLIVAGPLAYTLTWLALGRSHDGYSQRADSISVLAAFGAPRAWVMTAAFVVQAAAMAAAGRRFRGADRWVGLLLVLNAGATVLVAAAPISCGGQDATWCPPSEHPTSYAVHVVAATVALTALAAAPLAYAARGARPGRRIAVAAGTVMVALLGWFAVAESSGWAEKVMITTGIGWAAAFALTKEP